MRVSVLIYYALGFSYMLLAGELFYLSLKLDDIAAASNVNVTVYIAPTILILLGLTLIGAGVMLLSEPGEYPLAKLLGVSGLIITIAGIGMGIEYAARLHYENVSNVAIIPIYVSRQVSSPLGLNMVMYGGAILLFIAILPGAAFIITEYSRMIDVIVILLNAAIPSLAVLSTMLVIPGYVAIGVMSAVLEFLSLTSLVILDIYYALRTIPVERR